MSIPVYIPTNKIIHQVKVDLIDRGVPSVAHLVQGDNTLPVLKVSLYKGGQKYSISDLNPTEINIRCRNGDHSSVYTPIAGVDETGSIVYLEVPEEMTNAYGTSILVVEFKCSNTIINSSPIHLEIERNPVWNNSEPVEYGGVSFTAIDWDLEIVEYEVIT